MRCGPITAAIVNIATTQNATLSDAFQFGTPGDTSWSLTGMSFRMEVKASRDDGTPLYILSSGGGQIVVDDPVQRVLHLHVVDTDIQTNLPNAVYVYDFVMLDGSTPPVRTVLMQGTLTIGQGVTEGP